MSLHQKKKEKPQEKLFIFFFFQSGACSSVASLREAMKSRKRPMGGQAAPCPCPLHTVRQWDWVPPSPPKCRERSVCPGRPHTHTHTQTPHTHTHTSHTRSWKSPAPPRHWILGNAYTTKVQSEWENLNLQKRRKFSPELLY